MGGSGEGPPRPNVGDLRLQSDYTINDGLFGFGALAYQDDRFSGFQYQASASGGSGLQVLRLGYHQALRPGGLLVIGCCGRRYC